ncbi:hypothetical protein BJV82DRAFT_624042 [Fennellomyces sp. T-0311]|nr:hypothetical protein BJV82DRAFT_624042 [Fennellomyces sp. T-0311]
MTHHQSNDPPRTSTIQLAFMAVLPLDVLLKLFSLIEQRDCLTCMTVCRDWFHSVPEYTKSLWKTIDIYTKSVSVSSTCWELCLGEHVRNVTLKAFPKEQDLYNILQKLFDLRCTNIESLDFVNCTTTRHSTFLNLLRKFPLTHLRMTVHQSNVPFAHILNACPNLTHYTFQLGLAKDTFSEEPCVTDVPKLAAQFPNIIYLCLDLPLDPRKRLEPLLKRCPNLRCYVGVCSEEVGAREHDYVPIDLNKLLTYCPKVSHLLTDWSYETLSDTDSIITSDFGPTNGLRFLAVTEERYGPAEIRPLVAANQSTIEHLYLKARDPILLDDDSIYLDVFVSSPPPNLRTLVCNSFFKINGSSFTALLGPAMETLKLGDASGLEFSKSSLLQSLRIFPMLHTFDCNGLILSTDHAVISLFERLPALEELSLSFSTLTFAFFTMALGSLQNLKHLDFFDIIWKGDIPTRPFKKLPTSKLKSVRILYASNITYELLLSFVHTPTLTYLQAAVDYTLSGSDVEGLKQLVETLSRVKSLELANVQLVPFAVLDALASLPFLHHLHLDSCEYGNHSSAALHMDKDGLIRLLGSNMRLDTAYFGNMVVIDDMDKPKDKGDIGDLSYEAVADLIMKHAPSYQFNAPNKSYGLKQGNYWRTTTGVSFRRIK